MILELVKMGFWFAIGGICAIFASVLAVGFVVWCIDEVIDWHYEGEIPRHLPNEESEELL